MAKFIIKATITIDGSEIKTKHDALNELQVLLGCYEDMSSDDTEICISPDQTIKHFRCPFCGSEETESEDVEEYLCKECHTIFREDDVIAEPIRHHLSAILSANGTMNEDNGEISLPCEIPIGNGEIVTAINETRDGIIYFELKDRFRPEEFDFMGVKDLRIILNEIS